MMTTEMRKVVEELEEMMCEKNMELCEVCAMCPYAQRCEAEELLWGCSCWETSMGADL